MSSIAKKIVFMILVSLASSALSAMQERQAQWRDIDVNSLAFQANMIHQISWKIQLALEKEGYSYKDSYTMEKGWVKSDQKFIDWSIKTKILSDLVTIRITYDKSKEGAIMDGAYNVWVTK